LVPASVAAGELAAKIMFDPPAITVAPPARVVPKNFRRVIEVRDRRSEVKNQMTDYTATFYECS
jgi:hypothetical protein